jgi:methionine-gamma-lyase
MASQEKPHRNSGDQTPLDLATRVVHAGADCNDSSAVSVPIYQTSTFRFADAAEGADLSSQVAPSHLYTRWGNPTIKSLERAIADLESGEAALAFSSGMAAGVTAVMATIQGGDHVVAAQCLYAGMTELFERILPPFGVSATFVDPEQPGAIEAALRPNTRLIYVETPANPTLALTDLAEVARLGKQHKITTIADNTWACPWNQRPLELGIDTVVHSVTKYLSGHSDVIAGAVVGSQAWIDAAWPYLKIFGGCISPHDAWLVLRGIKTLAVRVERQNSNAQSLAEFLDQQEEVETVYYPGLASHPGHSLASRQMRGYGGMLSFEVRGGLQAGEKFLNSLQLATHAVSLGGTETLAVHPASTTHAPLTPEERLRGQISDGLIRISVGLESAEDLIRDFRQALDAVRVLV